MPFSPANLFPIWALLICLSFVVSRAAPGSNAKSILPEVRLAQGTLRGLRETTLLTKKPFYSFRGIPFAEPPVDDLRFKEPVKAKKWLGVWNATEQSPDCLQLIEGVDDWRFQVIGEENCLYLNVFTPKLNPDKDLMKVIVFIHGGAFMFFSSNYSGPQYLMEKDVVLVNINYRVGPLGFLSTGDNVVPGNNGLKDQLLALNWVQENIRSFGGDPKQVAIAGESAGSGSVIYHMLSKKSKGLFTHVMALSGSPLSPWGVVEKPEQVAKRLSDHFGCPTRDSKEMIECLRSRPVHSVVHNSLLFMPWRYFAPYGPVIEPKSPNAFIDEEPIKVLAAGQSTDVPLLISFTDEEGVYPGRGILANPTDLKRLKDEWIELLPILLIYNNTVEPNQRASTAQKIANKYKPDIPKNFIKMLSDRTFLAGIGENARLFSERYKAPVYSYRFRYAMKSKPVIEFDPGVYPAVGHGDDLPFILREVQRPIENNTDDVAVSKYMVDVWMNFISDKMPKSWTTVKQGLPKFTYKNINGANDKENDMQSEEDFGNIAFWKSLNLKENIL